MGKMAIDRSQSTLVDAFLRDEMARSNRALRTLAPIVSHLLQSDGATLVNDAVVARLRGMIGAIADQLLSTVDGQGNGTRVRESLINCLSSDEPLVDHLYALALEGALTTRLSERAGVDPVLSPLLQELIAAERSDTASLAMRTLAAQSRFVQSQTRLEISLGELPAELIARVLLSLKDMDAGLESSQVEKAAKHIKHSIDESESRISLLSRLLGSLNGGAIAALDLEHAGLALFASGAAALTKQTRESAVFACHEGQSVRLVLMLKAAGLGAGAIRGQLTQLGDHARPPIDLESMPQSLAIDALRELSGA